MRVDVYLPLLVSVLFGLAAPGVSRRLPPAQASRLLSVGSVIIAASTALSLGLLAFTYLGQQSEVAEIGHVTVATFRRHDPVHLSVAIAALLLIPVLGTLTVRAAFLRLRAILEAYRTCRLLPSGATPLVVVPDPGIAAYAVPGRPGRIVVSRELLSALPPAERRALLAHEQAHLDRHHHWHLALVAMAARLDPLLWRLPAAAAYSCERWADEIAAEAVGDRKTTARALARTGLLRAGSGAGPMAAMCATGTRVADRVSALLLCRPRSRPALVSAAVAGVLVAGIGAIAAGWDAHELVELAQRRQT